MSNIIKPNEITIEQITKAMIFHSGEPFVTSTQIAKHFGKPHNDLLKKIRAFHSFDELISLGKISQQIRIIKGREYPYLELDADAYVFTCISFTGKKAEAFKWAFIKAFKVATAEAITAKVTAQTNLTNENFFAFRKHGKKIHRGYTDAVKALCEYAEKLRGAPYEKQCHYYALIQKLVYKAVDVKGKKGIVQARDAFSPQLLEKIESIENKFADDIFDLIEDKIPYKEIYQHLKDISIDIIAEINHASTQEIQSKD